MLLKVKVYDSSSQENVENEMFKEKMADLQLMKFHKKL